MSTTWETDLKTRGKVSLSCLYSKCSFITYVALLVVDKLFKSNISPSATHDTKDQHATPECHPNTRVAILNRLAEWAKGTGLEKSDVIWLFGSAGVGKTAIGRSLAKLLLATTNITVASFLLSKADATRNTAQNIMSTLAYQISIANPEVQPHIIEALTRDPIAFSRSMSTQFRELIVKPILLSKANLPIFILIDGLDECLSPEERILILEAIRFSLPQLQGRAKILIASRPDHDIQNEFDHTDINEHTLQIDLQKDLHAYDDVRTFLRDRFAALKVSHPLKEFLDPSWPTEQAIEKLVVRASGGFIYPRTVMKFIETYYERPPRCLEIVLGLVTSNHHPFAVLDALYHCILSDARVDVERLLHILTIIVILSFERPCFWNTIFWVNESSTTFIETLLSLEPGDVGLALLDLRSLLTLEDSFGVPVVRFAHKSFQDYLLDRSRSKEFYIDEELGLKSIAHKCLKALQIRMIDNSAR